MARYTSAYSSFVSRLNEVEVLRRFASAKEKSDPVKLRHEINALCRGSIVLLSSHLEAYVRELGEVALDAMHAKAALRDAISPRFYYHLSKDIIEEVKETADHDRIAEKLFMFLQRDQLYWNRTGSFPQPLPIERFNKGFSNPVFTKIKAYFNRFGYSDYSRDLAKSLKAQYTVTINMVDHLVDTRNKIAHGDTAATKTPADVKEMISIIRNYCATTDNVFASWCKKEFCIIR